MVLALSTLERLTRARGDLRMGVPVMLTGPGAAVLVAAVEPMNQDRFDELRTLGPTELVLSARRAATLKIVPGNGEIARITLPDEAGLDWLRAMADPEKDLRHPMKGPFHILSDEDLDLQRAGLALVKSAHLLPALLIVHVHALTDPDLTRLVLSDIGPELMRSSPMHPVAAARLPMVASQAGRVHVFRPEDGGPEHYAIEIGQPDRIKPVLARLHSACFTGDVLGSLKCDCGPQLRAALAQMGAEGAGVLLYLNQEGRGIGLANKLRAYSLQDQGFDTVEANHRLGFEDDERDFRIGAAILRQMGFSAVRLLTNNPRKIAMMEAMDIAVAERVPLKVGQTDQNAGYLATKAQKSGHLL
ncbi:MAG: GTP cyclohydrolase II [Pseudorhodobacter sp.]